MKETPSGTPVGVDDPYEHAGVCDHLTDEGNCRYAFEHPEQDPEFARERREEDLRCPAADPGGDWDWEDCPHFRCRNRNRECIRCGLGERRMAHSDERPLLEEHHLSYTGERSSPSNQTQSDGSDEPETASQTPFDDSGERETLNHEITVFLCRWCHAKVHKSWARITDDVNPDPEAIAEKEGRRSREQSEASFESAAERYDRGE